MKTKLSITEIMIISFYFFLFITLSACTKEKQEKLTEDEEVLKALEAAEIKPVFIEEAGFYSSANKTRQITEVPVEEPEPELNLEPYHETYDPFTIIWEEDNDGVTTQIDIHYTFSYEKKNWKKLSIDGYDDATYIHYGQTRWGGKIPKWFRVKVNIVAGNDKTWYINTLKQKKDAYFHSRGISLFDYRNAMANVIEESCRLKVHDDKLSSSQIRNAITEGYDISNKENPSEREQELQAEVSFIESNVYSELTEEDEAFKYVGVNNQQFNRCLKMDYNRNVWSHDRYNRPPVPGKKLSNPIRAEPEEKPDRRSITTS